MVGSSQPAPRSWRLARVEVGDADDVEPARRARLRQEHGAELAGADQADGDGPAGGFPFEQHGVKIHERPSVTRASFRPIRAGGRGES